MLLKIIQNGTDGRIHLPKFTFTTDNAAMVAITGYYKFLDKQFCPVSEVPFARVEL